jgi:hypothetical protein
MLERLFLNLFSFNKWRGEFLCLVSSVHPTEGGIFPLFDNAKGFDYDMRGVYAMHIAFLTSASLAEILIFYTPRRAVSSATKWGMQMILYDRALEAHESGSVDAAAMEEILSGPADAPFFANDPRNIKRYEFYYTNRACYTKTESFISALVKLSRARFDSTKLPDQLLADYQTSRRFWRTPDVIDVSDIDRLLSAISLGKNSTDGKISYNGTYMSTATALESVREIALSDCHRHRRITRSTTALAAGAIEISSGADESEYVNLLALYMYY